jgi:putative transposase
MYKDFGKSVKKNDLQKEIASCKKEFPWVNDVHSQVVQDLTDRLYLAMKSFFRRVKAGEKPGYPKFKSKNKSNHRSFKFKQGVSVDMQSRKISLPKIGEVKFYGTQDVRGTISTCSIVLESDGWYAHMLCEEKRDFLPRNNSVVGLDLGVKTIASLSDGTTVENPHLDKEFDKKLAKLQRKLSRKKRGTKNNVAKNREKVKKEISKLYGKKKRKKLDYMHKATTKIIHENQVVICEDLNIKNLTKKCKPKKDEQGNYTNNGQAAKSGLNKSILEASLGMFVQMLEYKANTHGRTFIKVRPEHTSQDCHVCNYRNEDLTLSDREWTCPGCGTHHDRDSNASINILGRGIDQVIEYRKNMGGGHSLTTLKHKYGDMSHISNDMLLSILASASRGATSHNAAHQHWE